MTIKRRRRLGWLLLFILAIIVFASCNKQESLPATTTKEKVYLRVVEVDLDGKTMISNVVSFYKN